MPSETTNVAIYHYLSLYTTILLRLNYDYGFVQKARERWVAEIRLTDGSKSKTFDTKVEAKAWAHDMEQSIVKNSGITQGKTLGDAFDKYAAECLFDRKRQKVG